MYTKEDMNKALAMLALYKNEMAMKLATVPIEKLTEARMNLDGLKLFENRLTNEIKSSDSKFLHEMNK